ncbi:MAG TPA: hypothetical protein VM307_04595 [Egibacteraceae bacterium]|nr:hypothetical protein [Egibacteraceae bacterium]
MAAQLNACDSDDDGALDTVSDPVVVQASDKPVHEGTVCTGGTFRQVQLIDRRLGDYFANEIDRDGNTYIAASDTGQGGAVALPLVIRQVGGPGVGDPYDNPELWPDYVSDPGTDPDADPGPDPEPEPQCPGNADDRC